MSIGLPTLLDSGNAAIASSTSQATASVTPPANTVILVTASVLATLTADPTISGCGLTWTKIWRQPRGGDGREVMGWIGTGTGTAGRITIAAAGSDTWSGIDWEVWSHAGVKTSAPIVAGNTVGLSSTVPSDSPQIVSYNKAFLPGSAGIAVFGLGGGGVQAHTVGSGWIEIAATGTSSQFQVTQYTLAAATDAEITTTAGLQFYGFIFELAAPSPPTQVGITSQPTAAITQRVHDPIIVAIQNADGSTDTASTASVTLTLNKTSGPSSVVQQSAGTMTKNAVAGLATFDDLAVTCSDNALVPTTFTYTASSPGLTSATTAAVTPSVQSPKIPVTT